MADRTLLGIHHITAIAGDPQRNVDFYVGLLGLRLVKRTVNFDDPGSYHLYYGDGIGSPGTIMTFFAWPGAPRGRSGAGQIGATAFSIPAASLDFWTRHLAAHDVAVEGPIERFGDGVMRFADPDGLALELVATDAPDPRSGWADGPIPAAHAIRGFHAPTLLVSAPGPSEHLLTEVMGFRRVGEAAGRTRLAAGEDAPGSLVDLVVDAGPAGMQAAGTVHHIAWRTPDDAEQVAWQADLAQRGVPVTEVRDRQYFHSIYYREPGGILYEIATDPPGFAIDEAPAELGATLKLPPWLESQRSRIERALPPINLPAVERQEQQGAVR